MKDTKHSEQPRAAKVKKGASAICLIVGSIETAAFQAAARTFLAGGCVSPGYKSTEDNPRFTETSTNEKIVGFNAIAEKHDVMYRLKKEAGKENPRYAVFLRSARMGSIKLALEEYARTEYPRDEGGGWDLMAELEQCKKEAAIQFEELTAGKGIK
jgi:hypothetical protein